MPSQTAPSPSYHRLDPHEKSAPGFKNSAFEKLVHAVSPQKDRSDLAFGSTIAHNFRLAKGVMGFSDAAITNHSGHAEMHGQAAKHLLLVREALVEKYGLQEIAKKLDGSTRKALTAVEQARGMHGAPGLAKSALEILSVENVLKGKVSEIVAGVALEADEAMAAVPPLYRKRALAFLRGDYRSEDATSNAGLTHNGFIGDVFKRLAECQIKESFYKALAADPSMN